MSYSKIILRYASALFDLAEEKKLLTEVNADLELLAGTCASNRNLMVMLLDPVVTADRKQKVMEKIFGPHMNNLTLTFVRLLIRKGRESYLRPIAESFGNMYKESIGIKTAFVASAAGLDEAEKKRIHGILKKVTDKKIDLIEKVDPALLGGFVIDIDDYQVDQSLKTKIKELKKDFEKNLYTKGF